MVKFYRLDKDGRVSYTEKEFKKGILFEIATNKTKCVGIYQRNKSSQQLKM